MKRLTIVVLALLIVGYGLFEARRLIGGPEISIETPQDGSATSLQIITISGTARNISFLTINGHEAFIDETGHFTQDISPPPGYAIFTVQASDRFGRKATAQVHITVLNYCQNG